MKSKIQFVLCLLMGLMFVNGGLNKFFQYIPVPEDLPKEAMDMFMAMSQITWLMPLLAIFEIVGGVLFIIPKYRALGAIVLTPIMVGILAHHFTLMMGLTIPLIMGAILVWVIIDHWHKYVPMIRA